MDTKVLAYFVDVARMGSFAAVARQHDLDPSVISRLIAGLEQELNARLFHRTTRSLSLTEAGERLLLRVTPIVEELDQMFELVQGLNEQPSGLLRFTASNAFGQECLVPALPQFHELYPNVDVELILSDDNLNLVARNIDLAVRLGPGVEQGLVATKLMSTVYRVVVSPDYLATHQRLTKPEDLSDHSCLLFNFADYRHRWLFQQDNQHKEVAVSGHFYFSSALALRAAARQAMGPALLADWLVSGDLQQGTLIDVFPAYQVTATSFETGAWLIYQSRAYLPQKVRAMLDFLIARFRA